MNYYMYLCIRIEKDAHYRKVWVYIARRPLLGTLVEMYHILFF